MDERYEPRDISLDIAGIPHTVKAFPNECPQCHTAIEPDCRTWITINADSIQRCCVEVVYRCPKDGCNRLFIGRFRSEVALENEALASEGMVMLPAAHTTNALVLVECVPQTPAPYPWRDQIKSSFLTSDFFIYPLSF